MSRIDELIGQLCTDGVEYRDLGDVTRIVRGKRVVRKNLDESEGYPVYQNSLKPLGFYGESNRPGGTTFVICAGAAGDIGYCAEAFWSADDCFCPESNETVSGRYLYHVLLSMQLKLKAQVRKASIPRLSPKAIENLRIPVPPMEIQQEIVRVLDSFAELEAELEVELEAELEARRRQYAHYHDDMLNFAGRTDVPQMKLGELFEFKNGLNKGKDSFGHGTPIVNYKDVYQGGKITSACLYGLVELTESEMSRFRVKKGDVFFTRTSETKEEIGFSATLTEEIPSCVFSGFVLRARPTTCLLLPEYCAYCFSTHAVRKQIIKEATLTTRALTNGRSLGKVVIPVPPLEEQARIVAFLDKFDALVNDISQGIPAEIEARRKQYAYYRDKLLTFKERIA